MDRTDLAFAGAAAQARLIAAGEVSSRELTELFLERIARLDPTLNAWRVVDSGGALADADAADARRAAGAPGR
jgi:amidase